MEACLVEPARQQPARIVIGVLEIEGPGEIDLPIEGRQVARREIRTLIDHVAAALQGREELLLVDGREDAAELEEDPILQSRGDPRHEIERRLAANQPEIADHPLVRPPLVGAIPAHSPLTREMIQRGGVKLVLEEEPLPPITLSRQ